MTSNAIRIARTWWLQSVLCAAIWIAALGDIFFWIARGWGFPLGRYFDAFQDLVIYKSRFTYLHTPAFFQAHILDSRFEWPPAAFAYPPAATFLYGAFYKMSQPEAAYTTLMAVWCALCVYAVFKLLTPFLQKGLSRWVVSASLVLYSFPAVFLAERANLELFVWVLMTVGVVMYRKGNRYGAAVLFGLAASIKLYPIFLLGLLLKDKRSWPALLTGLSSAFAATLLAIVYCGPGLRFALHGFVEGLVRFKSEHAEAARIMEAPFDHSLFAAIKDFYLTGNASPAKWVGTYYLLAGGIATSLFFLRVRKLPFLNRLTFITVAMITLPPVSYEYTIVHLYLPLLGLSCILLSFFAQPRVRLPAPPLVAFACILLAMTPIGMLANGRFAYAGLVQLAALLCLLASTMYPWPSIDFLKTKMRVYEVSQRYAAAD